MSIELKKPSKELIDMIKSCAKYVSQLHNVIEKVKQKGRSEGFTDKEILDLIRTHLKGALTNRQIYWIVIEKEQRTIKRQLELKQKTIENKTVPIQLETTTETQTEDLGTDSVPDLRATINVQAEYIDKLEGEIEEKKEIAEAQGITRVKVSVSQLYRDVLMMRNTNATYTNILIDSTNNKYVRLEPL